MLVFVKAFSKLLLLVLFGFGIVLVPSLLSWISMNIVGRGFLAQIVGVIVFIACAVVMLYGWYRLAKLLMRMKSLADADGKDEEIGSR